MSDDVTNTETTEASREDGINVLDLLIVLAKRKWLILGLPFVMAVLTAIGSMFVPFVWTGTTRILPPQQNNMGAGALLSQLGQLGGALGGLANVAGGALGSVRANDIYIAMLKSRTMADNLIARFNLNKYYESEEYQSDTRKVLDKRTTIISGREGIITIEVEDKDPKFAVELANAYVEELGKLTKVIAVTEASRRRLFFEQQLAEAKENLTAAEIAAREALEQGGLMQVEAQGRTLIEVTARLRAQISVTEVLIGSMRTFAAEGSPDLQSARQELAALRQELARVEGTSPATAPGKSDKAGTGLQNVERLRKVKYYEILYELLARQYEVAKIDEARDATIIQVLDMAIIPDRRTRPKRALSVLISGTVFLFVAIVAAFVLEALEHARRNPGLVRRFQILVEHLRFWRAK
jgi:uncharacterized protein involved in exopolysaccharide biosynthesis